MEEFDFHPQKPELREQNSKGGLSVTVFSMLLFVLAFTFIFEDQLTFILFLVLVIFLHEAGHFLLMKVYKYEQVRMLFVPLMGAFVQGKKDKYSQKEGFLVALAGPIPGVLIGIALVIYAAQTQSSWGLELGFLFLLLNVLNLLPIDPLDGGQLLKLLIGSNHGKFQMIFAFISSLLLIGIGWYIGSYILIVIGFLLGFRVRAFQKKHQMHQELEKNDVGYITTYKLLSNKDYYAIKRVILEYTPALRQFVDHASEEESNVIIASQVNSVLVTPTAWDAKGAFKIGIVLLWLIAIAAPVVLFLNINLVWYAGL